MVFSLIALKAKESTSCFVPLIYYVLVLNVKGNICLQHEDTEVLFRTGSMAEAVSSSLFLKKKKQEKILSYCLQFVWVAFFALILKTVSMLVIETILIYLSLFQFVCPAETLSVHGLCF